MDRPSPCRVLLVEDQADASSTLRRLLELYGFEVEVAEDGLRGVQKALAWRPEAAVVDIGLALLKGCEVARQVRAAQGEGIHLIAISSHGRPEDKQRAAAAGFDVHLSRPVDPLELILPVALETGVLIACYHGRTPRAELLFLRAALPSFKVNGRKG